MGRIGKKLYRLTYDKPAVHRNALRFWQSMDEVKKQLDGIQPGRKRKSGGI